MMIRSFSGHAKLPEIWRALLFSVSLHSALAGLLMFAPSASVKSSIEQRCLEVQLVTLPGGGVPDGKAEGGRTSPFPVNGNTRLELMDKAPDASRLVSSHEDTGKSSGTEELENAHAPEATLATERNLAPNRIHGKAPAKPKTKRSSKPEGLAHDVHQKVDTCEVESGSAGTKKDEGLSGQSVFQEEGSGRGAAGSSGDGTGFAPGSHGVGQGPSLYNGPIDAQLGSANGPRFLHRVLPRYPRLARERGKEGSVLLGVTIDRQGRPVHVEMLKRAGCEFDDEAIRAVKSSTFTPARVDGRPVICKVLLPVRFELRGSEDD
jgi:periplasmic protein TonB